MDWSGYHNYWTLQVYGDNTTDMVLNKTLGAQPQLK